MASVDKGKATDIICLYFRKAFDMVLHHTLISKLARHGFEAWTMRWIKNWLNDDSKKDVINGSVHLKASHEWWPPGVSLGTNISSLSLSMT